MTPSVTPASYPPDMHHQRPESMVLRDEIPGIGPGDYADTEPPARPTSADFCSACGEERGCDPRLVEGLCPACLDLRDNPTACTRCGAEEGAHHHRLGRVVLDGGVCEGCRELDWQDRRDPTYRDRIEV